MQLVMALSRQVHDMGALWHRPLLSQDYALINPLQVDEALWSDLPVTPLVPKGFGAHAHLMPRLLELRLMSEDARIQLLERVSTQRRNSRFPYFSSLFVTDLSREEVVARLSGRLLVHGAEGSKALLRYYDPQVFRHLRWLLRQEQLNSLLLGIKSWDWTDGSGQWQRYRPVGAVPRSELRLTGEQWGDLQRLGLLSRCLRQVARNEPDKARDDAVAKSANSLLKAAYERHGLTDAADRCLYAEQAIRFHPEIHCHPGMVERIARVSNGGVGYVGACSDLDDAALQRFATDLRQSKGILS